MKKLIALFMGIFFILGCSMITSCGSDKDSLSGVYAYNSGEEDYGECYHFINHNTVVWYGSAHRGSFTNKYGVKFNKKIGSSGWYTTADDNGQTYTYTYEDNKVIIPMLGKIFTKSGNSLIVEGSSMTFEKQ